MKGFSRCERLAVLGEGLRRRGLRHAQQRGREQSSDDRDACRAEEGGRVAVRERVDVADLVGAGEKLLGFNSVGGITPGCRCSCS
jgi:predicted deacylase